MARTIQLPRVKIPHTQCTDPMESIRREWLVTNGIGGFASGTIAGALTRRYHGLLVAALNPPLGRTMLVSKLDETVTVKGHQYPLATNIWTSGIETPAGCRYIESFELVGGLPVWHYRVGNSRISKRIWMEHRKNVTFVQYELDKDSDAVEFDVKLLVNYRDYHYLVRPEGWNMEVVSFGPGVVIHPFESAVPIHVQCDNLKAAKAKWQIAPVWHHNFYLPVEAERGFDHLEHHLCAATCNMALKPGMTVTFTLATEPDSDVDPHGALKRVERRACARFDTWRSHTDTVVKDVPAALPTLAINAYQFLVRRPTPENPDGFTIIAGYPWFSDWGRDTMISLPGLTLAIGRPDIARQILLTWAKYVHEGLIPNRFPDEGDTPEYHTADATMWYLWAIDQYFRTTGDLKTLKELLPVVEDIIDWHCRGTRHEIHVAEDGLIYAGHEGINLTWMDAKIGDRVITPRTGKPIEINALWHNALCNIDEWNRQLGRKSHRDYALMAATTKKSFQRFWNESTNACYDLIDGPNGHDARIQANQIFAVSLNHSPLTAEQQRAVVNAVEEKLLTPVGLRTLSPDEPGYRGHYCGGPVDRDESYHTGTAWGWLLGPFVIAYHRVHNNRKAARELLEPMLEQVTEHGIGSISEIFDGNAPHTPNGTTAQAWSVAETLRAWHVTQQ